jgi:hypothetical protein
MSYVGFTAAAVGRLEQGIALSTSFRDMGVAMGRKPVPDHLATLRDWVRHAEQAGIDYAVIGGVALWAHVSDEQQRTTKDLDVVIRGKPEEAAARVAGQMEPAFEIARRVSDDFVELRHAPEGTPVHLISEQSTGIAGIVERAATLTVLGAAVRVADVRDFIRSKLRASGSAARARRYRQDLQDIVDILAANPDLNIDSIPSLSVKEKRVLDELARDARGPTD